MAAQEVLQVAYLMDPHCGWCFGFSETIRQFHDHVINDDRVTFKVMTGGLFIPGIAGSQEFADDKRPIAEQVERQFGVTFSPNYFDNVLAVPRIDSTPGSRAILACDVLDQQRTLVFAARIIDAAFVKANNISLSDVVLDIAEEDGFDRAVFLETMESSAVSDALDRSLRFSAAAQTGFPSTFLIGNDKRLQHLGGTNLTADDLTQAVNDFISTTGS